MRTLNDIANAPTEVLIQREYHRIATLSGNRIVRDYYKTQALRGQERVTRLLPRPKPSLWQSIVNLIMGITGKKRAVIAQTR